MFDIKELQFLFNKAMAQQDGMYWDQNEHGYSLEQLYNIAGKEDRVITITLRRGSPSEQIWGDTITCCFLYTESERIRLMEGINNGSSNYGRVKAKDLLNVFTDEQKDRLRTDGVDTHDIIEILVAPLLQRNNVYNGDNLRALNQIKIQVEPEPPFEEIKFEFGTLCKFLEHGMLLTPDEKIDFLALKLLLGVKLTDEERAKVLDDKGKIHNNDVSWRFLFHKSRLHELSYELKKTQDQLKFNRRIERLSYLDGQLKDMGSSFEKLHVENPIFFEQIVKKALMFEEERLNHIGRYPIYLTYEGYIHIALRHIKEWQFNDYYKDRDKFQLREEDVVPTLSHIIIEINEDYQSKKEARPDFQYRKFGKQSIYLNGDYYMIHIAADGSIENFSKTVYKGK